MGLSRARRVVQVPHQGSCAVHGFAMYLARRCFCLLGSCHSLLLGLVIISVAFPPAAARAFELSWRPRIEVSTRATDNLRTAIADEEAAWGFDTGGGVAIQAASDTWASRITPAFNVRRFAIGEGADAEEYEVRTSSQWAATARATATLDLDYVRNSTLTTELSDAGRQTTVANRDTLTVAPGVAILVSDATTLNLQFLYSDVSFEQVPGASFQDYDYKQGSVQGTHAITNRFSVFTSIYLSEFRTPANQGKSITYGGQAGVRYGLSDTLDTEFGVGFSQSDIDFQTVQFAGLQFDIEPLTGVPVLVPAFVLVSSHVTENGPIAQASIHKEFRYTDVRLDYSRAVSPSSLGAQSVSDDIALIFDHRFTRRLSATFQGRYDMRSTESDSVTTGRGNLNRNQVMVSGTVRYRVTEEFTVAATYRFFRNDISASNGIAYNNSMFITLVYNGRPRFLPSP